MRLRVFRRQADRAYPFGGLRRRSMFGFIAGLVAPAGAEPGRRSAAADDLAGNGLAAYGRSFRALLIHPASAEQVAAAYLIQISQRDPQRVAIMLGMEEVLRQAPASGRLPELQQWLSKQIRSDFATGATVMADGWCLSRTEVAACLLAAG